MWTNPRLSVSQFRSFVPRVHKSAISKFIPEVSEAFNEALKDKYMKIGKYISLMESVI